MTSADEMATVRIDRFRELWIHTGTACNLECPFCLEGSRPGDTRLERITLTDIRPHLDSAIRLGVERFAFTGGEPLIVKDIVKILEYALQLKPCLVLTNGTAPLIKRVHQLRMLERQPHTLAFRVSLDHPDEKRHDAERGWGNFKRAIDGLKLLHQHGFEVSIARHLREGENSAEIDSQFRELLSKHRLPQAMPIVALPEFGRPGADNIAEPIASSALADAGRATETLMCGRSRMVVKRAAAVRLVACALVDDDERFEMGDDLARSASAPVVLRHHRCRQCLRFGAHL